jgi:hypothetical protein
MTFTGMIFIKTTFMTFNRKIQLYNIHQNEIYQNTKQNNIH